MRIKRYIIISAIVGFSTAVSISASVNSTRDGHASAERSRDVGVVLRQPSDPSRLTG